MGWFSDVLGTNTGPAANNYDALGAKAAGFGSGAAKAVDDAQTFREGQFTSTLQPAVASQLGLAKSQSTKQVGLSDTMASNGTADRTLAGTTFNPLTSQFGTEVAGYGNEADQTRAGNDARDAVLTDASQQKDDAVRKLRGMGVNVNSGAVAEALAQTGVTAAAKSAAASNAAKESTRLAGINLRGNAVALGNQTKAAADSEIKGASDIAAGAADTAGKGISSALSTDQLMTNGVGDALQAANININSNLGLAKLVSDDWKTGQATNSANSANAGALAKWLLGNNASSSGVAGAIASGAGQVAGAIGNGVGKVWDWATGLWKDQPTTGSGTDQSIIDQTPAEPYDDSDKTNQDLMDDLNTPPAEYTTDNGMDESAGNQFDPDFDYFA